MKPYYQDDKSRITIYHGDAEDVLPVVASVVITDPPYGISDAPNRTVTTPRGTRRGARDGAVNTWHPDSDWDEAIDPLWCQLVAASAPTVAWFGQWRKRETVERAMSMPLRAEIVWAKNTHVGPPCPLAARDERIWIFAVAGVIGQVFETSVWDEPIIPTWAHRWHKNEKPIALMRRLIRWLTEPEAVVLDPSAIGVEKDERYCEIAVKRLSQDVLPLFDGEVA